MQEALRSGGRLLDQAVCMKSKLPNDKEGKMKRTIVFALSLGAILVLCSSYAWAAAPRKGLVAEYLFEGNASDTSGEGNHGNVYDAVLSKDRFNRPKAAFAFDGTTSYIEVPNNPSLQLTNSLTITAWVQTVSAMDAPIVLKGDGNNWYYFGVWKGTLDLEFNNNTGHLGSTEIPVGKWVHVAATWDGTNIKHYVNGIQDTATKEFIGTISNTDASLYMGSSFQTILNGKLDDVRIYNRALTAAEIDAVYHDKDPVISAFIVTPDAGSTPLAVNFECRAKSPNSTISQYLWDVNGDGTTDFVTSVGTLLHTFTTNGTYKPRVRVVDSAGYKANSDYLRVKVANGPELAGKVEYYHFDDTAKSVEMKVRVYNWGNADAAPFKVGFAISDNGIGSTTFKTVPVTGGLTAGQSILLTLSNTFAESIYGRMVGMTIDAGKKVAEVDETNNDLQVFIGSAAK